MNKKALLIFLGLFIVILSMGVVSATRDCYQESFNVANQTGIDGLAGFNCELNYTGTYSITNSSTPGNGQGTIYMTYAKPLYATNNSIWKVQASSTGAFGVQVPTLANYSIPATCWIQSTLQFSLSSDVTATNNAIGSCYNGTTWIQIFNLTNPTGANDGITPNAVGYLNAIDGSWTTSGSFFNSWGTGATGIGTGGGQYLYEEAMIWAENEKNITINVYQRTTNAVLPAYNINLSGYNQSFNGNGVDTYTIINNLPAALYNVTVTSPGYYNCTFLNANLTTNSVFTCPMYNNILNITAYNSYVNTAISNYSVIVSLNNYSETYNSINTTNQVFLIQGIVYNLLFTQPTYVNSTTTYMPVASSSSLNQSMNQTIINLTFTDAFTSAVHIGSVIINDTGNANHTYNVTNGTLILTPTAGTNNFTAQIAGNTFAQTFSITATGGEISSRTIPLYPVLTLSFYDEYKSLSGLTFFNFSSPDLTRVTLFCTAPTTYTYSAIIPNSTYGNYTVASPCIFNTIRFDLSWNNIGGSAFSYYRVLAFESNATNFNVKVFLLDAFAHDGVLTYLKPYDIFGVYTVDQHTKVAAYEVFPTGIELVTSDFITAQGQITATLMQGGRYILTVVADGIPVRTLGPYSADSPGQQILRLFDVTLTGPPVNQVATNTLVDKGNSTIAMSYQDGTVSTTSLTLSLYNSSCPVNNIFTTTPVLSFTYTGAELATSSYSATLIYNVTDSPIYNASNVANFCALYNYTTPSTGTILSAGTIQYSSYNPMPSTFASQWTFAWIFIFLILLVALGANARTAAPLSLVIALFTWLMYFWHWIGTGAVPGVSYNVVFGLVTLIAILFNLKRVF